MPRASKRIAARQAELSKKKRHKNPPRLSEVPGAETAEEAEAAEPGTNGSVTTPSDHAAPTPVEKPRPSGPPAFRVPSRPRIGVAASTDTARRAMPGLPYLKSDLALLGVITVAMVVILVVLGFIL